DDARAPRSGHPREAGSIGAGPVGARGTGPRGAPVQGTELARRPHLAVLRGAALRAPADLAGGAEPRLAAAPRRRPGDAVDSGADPQRDPDPRAAGPRAGPGTRRSRRRARCVARGDGVPEIAAGRTLMVYSAAEPGGGWR